MPAARSASRRWGWHRLEPGWAERIVAHAAPTDADLVLDLGAGSGRLTGPLARTGASVLALELHPRRVATLRERFADAPHVRVVCADLDALRLPRRPFCVVANPPFALTTSILRRLTGRESRLVRADLVVPRHVAARWADGRGAGASSAMRRFEFRYAFDVPPRAFQPVHPSGAAVLSIERRGRHRPGRTN